MFMCDANLQGSRSRIMEDIEYSAATTHEDFTDIVEFVVEFMWPTEPLAAAIDMCPPGYR